jgi:hypothetical protein
VVLLLLAFRIGPQMATHSGRRRILAAWRRISRWEYWPPWVLYPPVVIYCLWLGIRYRSLFAFTAANPAIEYSGFVGESKALILDALPEEWVAEFESIDPGDPRDGLEMVTAFLAAQKMSYPVVLKPDVGERGRAVKVARSDEDVIEYFQDIPGLTIVQRFIPGEEYGLFFYRDPETDEGRILSITDKRFPSVAGDGIRTLHQLILDDDRAVAMHKTYARVNRARLESVMPEGEQIQLVDIGTHSRGAVFLDGGHLLTPEMEHTFSQIAGAFEGFHFGRFDVRVGSGEALSAGRDFKIIELNGVTSEATHIYQPGSSLIAAYRTLFAQWKLAYRIGVRNIGAGAKPARLLPLLRSLMALAKRTRPYRPASSQLESPDPGDSR